MAITTHGSQANKIETLGGDGQFEHVKQYLAQKNYLLCDCPRADFLAQDSIQSMCLHYGPRRYYKSVT